MRLNSSGGLTPSAIDSIAMEVDWERPSYVPIDAASLSALIRLWCPHGIVTRCELISNGGRNTNYRIGFENRATEFVMRLYALEVEAWKKERAIYKSLRGSIPLARVVYSGFEPSIFDRPLAVFEYVEGETLLERMAGGRLPPPSLLRSLGASLARIRERKYDKIGDLDEQLQPGGDLPPLDSWVDLFTDEVVSERLGVEAAARYRAFVQRHRPELKEIAEWIALVHGDYRPTNILLRGDGLAAIIDWEFCMAWHPLSDLGQFRQAWLDVAFNGGRVCARL
jgi:aminoglycoside phosphotransferase (APT) family kinase protein